MMFEEKLAQRTNQSINPSQKYAEENIENVIKTINHQQNQKFSQNQLAPIYANESDSDSSELGFNI